MNADVNERNERVADACDAGNHSWCDPHDCGDALCAFQIGGGHIGSRDLDPPEYCDNQVAPYSAHCPNHQWW